jgi:hypothetical protein
MTAFLNLDHAVNEDNRQANAWAMGFLHGVRMLYARRGKTIDRDKELAVIRELRSINPVWPRGELQGHTDWLFDGRYDEFMARTSPPCAAHSVADARDEVRYPAWMERHPSTGEVPE